MPFADATLKLAENIIDSCAARELSLTAAESCTGGLITACLTEIPGSSAVVDRGFVTYSNRAKQELLGVAADTLIGHGAVSAEVAEAMATGAKKQANVDLAIAVTGIAGPGGATADKPVGLVYLALAHKEQIQIAREIFPGNRHAVRQATLIRALVMIEEILRRH
ncbi:MAG: CinA family protein [Pseudomonadota bacterium]